MATKLPANKVMLPNRLMAFVGTEFDEPRGKTAIVTKGGKLLGPYHSSSLPTPYKRRTGGTVFACM